MFERGFAARAELEAAKGEVTAVELDIARLKQQLQAATGAAEHASVKARFAGVIAKKFHSEGDLVNASPTDPVLRVIDPTQVQIAMKVPAGPRADSTRPAGDHRRPTAPNRPSW
jgi:multidrug resistance efflux pump